MKHIHAELMLQYAQDAMETDKPWERWEVRQFTDCGWETMFFHPGWKPEFSYRRKQKTININGYEVPEPVRTSLEAGKIYYVPTLNSSTPTQEWRWENETIDIRHLNRGLVHLTKEAAIQHALALLAFTKYRQSK